MPYFTLDVAPDGPIVWALVHISEPRIEALKTTGAAIPKPVKVRALLDTGASSTCVDPKVLSALNLTPTGSTQVLTPSTGSTPHLTELYDVALIVPGAAANVPPLIVRALPVMKSELDCQGIQVLIGRDVLKRCTLTYVGGPQSFFTLSY